MRDSAGTRKQRRPCIVDVDEFDTTWVQRALLGAPAKRRIRPGRIAVLLAIVAAAVAVAVVTHH